MVFKSPEQEIRELRGWLRPDPRRRLLPAWGLGVVLILLGAFICAYFFHRDTRSPLPDEDGLILWLIMGLLSVLCGMLTMVLSALFVLQDNRSLGFREDGLVYRSIDGAEQCFLWVNIQNMTPDQPKSIDLLLQGGQHANLRLDWLDVDMHLLTDALQRAQQSFLLGTTYSLFDHLSDLEIPPCLPLHLTQEPSRSDLQDK